MSIKMSIPPKLPPIPPLDAAAQAAVFARQKSLAKPRGALGRLEFLSAQLAAMTGSIDWQPTKPVVLVCAGDHGIAEQGVSVYPRAFTKQLVQSILKDESAVSVIARQYNAQVVVVDAGVAGILPAHPNLVSEKINYGTADFTKAMAMTPGHADKAIQLGLQLAAQAIEAGANMIAVGELGIGSTASAAALICALTDQPPERVVGRGTGVNGETLARKIALIEDALAHHQPVDEDALAKFGGYEMAVLLGVMMSAASRRVPVMLDGVITAAVALLAAKIDPQAVKYMVAGHRGTEPGQHIVLEILGLTPVLDLGLRVGEGAGALLALPIIDAAMRTLQEMGTFEQGG